MAPPLRWILPVKNLDDAKSRLRVPGVRLPELVLAMLHDTLEAVLAAQAGDVVLVSPDDRVRRLAARTGVGYLRHGGALNESVAAVCAPGRRCAALLPDLPAVTTAELLSAIESDRGFVPDARGRGTTLAVDVALVPRFGPDSAAAFEAAGLPRLPAGPGLRRDVDTAADLEAARRLGLGRHTRAALARTVDTPVSTAG